MDKEDWIALLLDRGSGCLGSVLIVLGPIFAAVWTYIELPKKIAWLTQAESVLAAILAAALAFFLAIIVNSVLAGVIEGIFGRIEFAYYPGRGWVRLGKWLRH